MGKAHAAAHAGMFGGKGAWHRAGHRVRRCRTPPRKDPAHKASRQGVTGMFQPGLQARNTRWRSFGRRRPFVVRIGWARAPHAPRRNRPAAGALFRPRSEAFTDKAYHDFTEDRDDRQGHPQRLLHGCRRAPSGHQRKTGGQRGEETSQAHEGSRRKTGRPVRQHEEVARD